MTVEHGQFWSKSDLETLERYPHWSLATTAKVLGRTPGAVSNMRHQIRHGKHSPRRDETRAPGITAKARDVYYRTAARPLDSKCPTHNIELPATGLCEDCN